VLLAVLLAGRLNVSLSDRNSLRVFALLPQSADLGAQPGKVILPVRLRGSRKRDPAHQPCRRQATHHARHEPCCTSLTNLAELYRARGRLAEAEPLHKRGLAILEKALGPGHPNVGTPLFSLAELYETQRRVAEAEPLHRRSLAIRLRSREIRFCIWPVTGTEAGVSWRRSG
jgi:Tetratricopeptide repeat